MSSQYVGAHVEVLSGNAAALALALAASGGDEASKGRSGAPGDAALRAAGDSADGKRASSPGARLEEGEEEEHEGGANVDDGMAAASTVERCLLPWPLRRCADELRAYTGCMGVGGTRKSCRTAEPPTPSTSSCMVRKRRPSSASMAPTSRCRFSDSGRWRFMRRRRPTARLATCLICLSAGERRYSTTVTSSANCSVSGRSPRRRLRSVPSRGVPTFSSSCALRSCCCSRCGCSAERPFPKLPESCGNTLIRLCNSDESLPPLMLAVLRTHTALAPLFLLSFPHRTALVLLLGQWASQRSTRSKPTCLEQKRISHLISPIPAPRSAHGAELRAPTLPWLPRPPARHRFTFTGGVPPDVGLSQHHQWHQ